MECDMKEEREWKEGDTKYLYSQVVKEEHNFIGWQGEEGVKHEVTHDFKQEVVDDFKCEVENNVYYDESQLDAGKYIKTEEGRDGARSEDDQLYCYYCGYETKYKQNLRRHIVRSHSDSIYWSPEGGVPFMCGRCCRMFRFKYDLETHRKIVHDYRRKVECFFCNYDICRKNRLLGHIMKKHDDGRCSGVFESVQKCLWCEYASSERGALLNHILDIHRNLYKTSGRKRGRYECRLCRHVANCHRDLVCHIDGVHKKIKPYRCSLCSFASVRQSDVNIHVNAVHFKIRPFACQECDYKSSYMKHLRRHISSRHINVQNKRKYSRRYL